MEKSYRFPSGTSYLVFGLLLLILSSGCAPISKELRAQADRTLSFQQVFQNPEANKDKIVICCGENITRTRILIIHGGIMEIMARDGAIRNGRNAFFSFSSPLLFTKKGTAKDLLNMFLLLDEQG